MITVPTLIIAEKPNVAEDIAVAFGITPSGSDYFTGGALTITWCKGHLLTLAAPKDYNPDWAHWDAAHLPLAPPGMAFRYLPRNDEAERRLDLIGRLASKAGCIVNACDAAREGEYIFELVMDYIRKDLPPVVDIQRLWLNTNTTEGILEAWKERRPASSPRYVALARAARARDQADWLLGMNGTQAATLALPARKPARASTIQPKSQPWSIGRVQTAVLGQVVHRDIHIRRFESKPYGSIYLKFNDDAGRRQYDAKLLVPEGFERLGNFKALFSDDSHAGAVEHLIRSRLGMGQVWTVKEKVYYPKHYPPRLFSLVALQRHCAITQGWSSHQTLEAVQYAYERDKSVTYPRTDAEVLPVAYAARADELYEKLHPIMCKEAPFFAALPAYPPHGMPEPVRLFDDRRLKDHYAIIPTGVVPPMPPPGKDPSPSRIVWQSIMRRFMMAFSPPAELAEIDRLTEIGYTLTFQFRGNPPGHILPFYAVTKAKWLVKPGWYDLAKALRHCLPEDIPATDPFPTEVKTAKLEKTELYRGYTNSPDPYTEDTLLGAMDTENLGTSATRADILEVLLDREYIERRPGKPPMLRSLPRGSYLVEALQGASLEYLAQSSVTANWEAELQKIEDGDPAALTLEAFLDMVFMRVKEMVAVLRKPPVPALQIVCPKSGLPVLERDEYYSFPGYPDLVCPKELYRRPMSAREYRDVLVCREGFGPFEDFVSAKTGAKYSAHLVYDPKKNAIVLKFK